MADDKKTSVVADDGEARLRSEAMARVEKWLDANRQEFGFDAGAQEVVDVAFLGQMFGGGLDDEVDGLLMRVRNALAAEGGG